MKEAKIKLDIDDYERERLGRKPLEEERIPEELRAKIPLFTKKEREVIGITPTEEAWAKVGMMTLSSIICVHPDDYSEEQSFKAERLKLWEKTKDEIKKEVGYEVEQHRIGSKL